MRPFMVHGVPAMTPSVCHTHTHTHTPARPSPRKRQMVRLGWAASRGGTGGAARGTGAGRTGGRTRAGFARLLPLVLRTKRRLFRFPGGRRDATFASPADEAALVSLPWRVKRRFFSQALAGAGRRMRGGARRGRASLRGGRARGCLALRAVAVEDLLAEGEQHLRGGGCRGGGAHRRRAQERSGKAAPGWSGGSGAGGLCCLYKRALYGKRRLLGESFALYTSIVIVHCFRTCAASCSPMLIFLRLLVFQYIKDILT